MSVKITWLGHAAFSLDLDGHPVLIDPFLTGNPLATLTPADLKPELILISNPQEGYEKDVIAIAQAAKSQVIADFEPGKWAAEAHIPHLLRLQPGETFQNHFMDVLWLGALQDKQTPGKVSGFVMATDQHKLYYAGQTHLFNEMAEIGDMGIDLAFLPVGGRQMMTPAESLRAIELIRPQVVIPTHHSTYAEIAQDIGDWANRVNSQTAAKPVVLDPDGTYILA